METEKTPVIDLTEVQRSEGNTNVEEKGSALKSYFRHIEEMTEEDERAASLFSGKAEKRMHLIRQRSLSELCQPEAPLYKIRISIQNMCL
ncbi:hypothetical protein Trydic_g17200 [Trypoxylus dichotomus]